MVFMTTPDSVATKGEMIIATPIAYRVSTITKPSNQVT